jgi:hypothetical protein
MLNLCLTLEEDNKQRRYIKSSLPVRQSWKLSLRVRNLSLTLKRTTNKEDAKSRLYLCVRSGSVVDECVLQESPEHEEDADARPHVNSLIERHHRDVHTFIILPSGCLGSFDVECLQPALNVRLRLRG